MSTATPYDIILVPDPVLKQVSSPIENITDEIRDQAARMIESMYAAPGIGLAANQVGIANRMFIMDCGYDKNDAATRRSTVMINPEIVKKSDDTSSMEEGCLSIPQQYAEVTRPATVIVKYTDLDGQVFEREVTELESHCVQHELDHLNGVLFVDYLSKLKRDMMIKKVEKMKKTHIL